LSTNPLKRVNKESKRRAWAVGIFPNEARVIRLGGSVCVKWLWLRFCGPVTRCNRALCQDHVCFAA
jgi:hypothetical protein